MSEPSAPTATAVKAATIATAAAVPVIGASWLDILGANLLIAIGAFSGAVLNFWAEEAPPLNGLFSAVARRHLWAPLIRRVVMALFATMIPAQWINADLVANHWSSPQFGQSIWYVLGLTAFVVGLYGERALKWLAERVIPSKAKET